ncbi:hypothetical protein GYN67_06065 [Lactococcus piscium]|uniref:hypothetical protein n=1 Tax=Pseudolactococcus carnosus TaxID=2749961 RepID=UPI001FBBB6FD|nr:hypothetical protein [Lactococcus carnosus]MCJ1996248.1 hypothetical protein [Lactococcus carnosus]
MLNNIGNKTIKLGYGLFLFLTCFWVIVSIGYGTTLIENLNVYGYILALLSIILLLSQKAKTLLNKVVIFFYRYWYMTILFVFSYQVVIIISNSALVTGDTTAIIENIRGISNHNYFSAFPNNFIYGLYVKVVYQVFGMKYLILFQELVNIVILDISIVLLSKTIGKYLNQRIAGIYFILSIGLIGLHPQFLSTYTDSWSYFTSTFVCLIVIKLLAGKVKVYDYISLCFFVGLGYIIRPTIIIYLLALVFVLILRMIISYDKQTSIRVIKGILSGVLGILIFTCAISVVKTTNTLEFKNGYAKSLSYFFDLGLTSTGAAHAELPAKALDVNSPDYVIEPLIARDIKIRLRHYSLQQTVTKFKIAFQEGNLGWRIEQPLSYVKLQKNNVTSKFIESKIGKKIRNYIFFQGSNFTNLDLFLQIIWIAMIYGIIVRVLGIIKENDFTSINLFLTLVGLGAFIYLLLFEAGRSRYLLSFLPILILLSAFGYHPVKEKNE